MTESKIQLVMVTGMSGAGKTVAIQSFEDLGYFTIDNMPPALLLKFIELMRHSPDNNKLAVVVDMRSRSFFNEIRTILDELDNQEDLDFKVLFLDATDSELVARYKETRRSHPLAADGRVLDGITLERELLSPLKNISQNVVDTTELTPRNLRKTIAEQFASQDNQPDFRVEVMSFGFKYGLPIDADLVFDVRFLPNPYYKLELRNLTGQDPAVYDYVMDHPESEEFYSHLHDLIVPILPSYKREGKSVLTIAMGCTGGQHRSVAFAERLAHDLEKPKVTVIGGGTGISVILDSLRKKPVDITAIVTVADDGGSSGELRKNIQKLTPPGDLRNVLVAMSDMPRFYEKVFQYRFADDDGPLAGHPLGNLIIAGISEMQGSTYNAMQLLTKFFHTTGKIYPSSDSPLTLHAVFQDGKEVVGESHIANYTGMIDHVYVTNTFDQERPKASKKVVEAILESDMVVLGPGSLFTSILPNLMIDEIGKAILETKAQVAYVCNIMTQRGETEHFTDSDHVAVLHKHLGEKFIDTVLVNINQVPTAYMNSNKFDEYLVQVEHDFKGLRSQVPQVISSDFLKLVNGGAFHDGEKVVEELMQIVQVRK